jgi:6,7-dimethyl-8-ribityllumazine synthase
LVAESVTQSLQQIAVYHVTPVIHEVILCDDSKQAYARCIGSKLNRGKEAARAALAMMDSMGQIQHSVTRVFPNK